MVWGGNTEKWETAPLAVITPSLTVPFPFPLSPYRSLCVSLLNSHLSVLGLQHRGGARRHVLSEREPPLGNQYVKVIRGRFSTCSCVHTEHKTCLIKILRFDPLFLNYFWTLSVEMFLRNDHFHFFGFYKEYYTFFLITYTLMCENQGRINANRSTFCLHASPSTHSSRVREGSRHIMPLNLTCGFEYARPCGEDQFFQLSCCRGQCVCHAII